MAAAARVIAIAGNSTAAASSCLHIKTPFALQRCSNGLRFNNVRRSSKRLFSCNAIYNPQVQIKQEGQPETLDYRVFFEDTSGKKISPWHDVPLHLGDGVFSFIVEIPKESSAKMEVATDEPYTPIKQDTKKGKLRYYP
ncbi:hypothetical protein Golob_002984 [Gossypium lobatum]|uniref:inorganic diphosphatase n=1 Tax=Gossypium lobatum TaxID=34289 RepID=A0A7J8N6N0_9ROSI|nr:hypothetical protein [Gossypium lobatum]